MTPRDQYRAGPMPPQHQQHMGGMPPQAAMQPPSMGYGGPSGLTSYQVTTLVRLES